jgi:hypothetical protein
MRHDRSRTGLREKGVVFGELDIPQATMSVVSLRQVWSKLCPIRFKESSRKNSEFDTVNHGQK